jgi:hypothetical protein
MCGQSDPDADDGVYYKQIDTVYAGTYVGSGESSFTYSRDEDGVCSYEFIPRGNYCDNLFLDGGTYYTTRTTTVTLSGGASGGGGSCEDGQVSTSTVSGSYSTSSTQTSTISAGNAGCETNTTTTYTGSSSYNYSQTCCPCCSGCPTTQVSCTSSRNTDGTWSGSSTEVFFDGEETHTTVTPISGPCPTNYTNPSQSSTTYSGPVTEQEGSVTYSSADTDSDAADAAEWSEWSGVAVGGSFARTAAGGAALVYTAADLGLEAMTGKGISERIGESIGGGVGSFLYGDTSQPAFTQEELAASIANMPKQQQPIAPAAAPNQGPVLMPQEHSYVPQFLRSYEQATRPRRAAEAYLNLPDGPTDPLNPPRPDEGALFETINKEQSGGRIDWDTLNRNRRLYTSGAEGESRDETIAKFANWSMGRLGYEDAKTTQKNAARTLSSPQPTFSQMFGISQSPEDAASRLGVSPRETPTPEPPILEQAGGGGLEDGSQATAKTDTQQVDLSRWFGRDSGSVERAAPPDALTFVPNERIQGMDEDYVRQMGFSSEVIAQNPTALAAVQKKALRNPVEIEEPERFPAPSVNDTSATSRMDIAQPSAAKATSGGRSNRCSAGELKPRAAELFGAKRKGNSLGTK